MKPEEIKLSDWSRILFGPVPPEFYIELIIRGLFVYLLLMVSMRIMGKRMASQIGRIELAALVSLASAIGVPMLSPTNGILPAIIIAAIIVGMTRLISLLSLKNKKFENVVQGDLDTLVQDGIMRLDIMKRVRITRERLFAELRSENLKHLGMVKRLYMEANGTFTLVQNDARQPGLLVLPDWDEAFISENLRTTSTAICKECGEKKPGNNKVNDKEVTCTNCGANVWTAAVVEY
ncbi:MAG TPA: YetF domain-containing protein [Segetibacter sp.]